MPEDMTPGEMARSINRLTEQIRDLVTEIRQDRTHVSETYLRKDVYKAEREADREDVDAIERRMASQEGFRRQIVIGAVVGLILIAAQIVLTVAGLPGGGGL